MSITNNTSNKIDWSLAPEGTTHRDPKGLSIEWYKFKKGLVFYFIDDTWRLSGSFWIKNLHLLSPKPEVQIQNSYLTLQSKVYYQIFQSSLAETIVQIELQDSLSTTEDEIQRIEALTPPLSACTKDDLESSRKLLKSLKTVMEYYGC